MSQIDALQRQVEELGRQVARLRQAVAGRVDNPLASVFPVKRDGDAWQEQTVVGGSMADFTGGRTSDGSAPFKIIEDADVEFVAEIESFVGGARVGQYVLLSSKANWIRVALTQTGGVAGDADTTCTFTYSATDADGNDLGTGLSPTFQWRIRMMAAASVGWGYMDDSGEFVLEFANETFPAATDCEDDEEGG